MGVKASKPVESEIEENGFILRTRADLGSIGGMRVWPAGRTLASAISDRSVEVRGKRVIELGCGLALPALAACKAGAAAVTATDRPGLRDLVEHNALKNSCDLTFKEFDWSETENAELGKADLIIAADVIYYEEQDPFLQGLRFCFKQTGATEAVLAYKERSELDRQFLDDTILPEYSITKKVLIDNTEIYWLRQK